MKAKPPKSPKEYDVGFGKPPVQTRFAPGKSGNIHGRRGKPKAKKVGNPLERLLNEKLRVTEGGTIRVISKAEAVLASLVHAAISGDVSAGKYILTMRSQIERDD